MFLFRRKNKGSRDADYSLLNADMHSHLLPGIDDGSPDLETSVELIRGLQELGYKKLITTPHILWDVYKNTSEVILEKLELVRQRLREENIDIELHAAAEYFIDDHLVDLVERKERLLTFGNNMVLVEFSMASRPFEFKKLFFDLQIQGYQPVLAHPERYVYLEPTKSFYDELKNAGYFFQLNLLSLRGYYGGAAANIARHLVKKGYYDLIGTDLHHTAHLSALNAGSTFTSVQPLLQSEKILNREL